MLTDNILHKRGTTLQHTHDSVQKILWPEPCGQPRSPCRGIACAHSCSCMLQEQTPTTEDAQNRREILQQLDDIVQTGLPDYPGLCIQPYGSYVSGLYCPSGDLDLSIEGTPIDG